MSRRRGKGMTALRIASADQFLLACLSLALVVAGCASFAPKPIEDSGFQERARTREDGSVRVSVAALTEAEARHVFGMDLASEGVQPVWVRIENGDDSRYLIPPIALDPEYFSPLEVAWEGHGWFSDRANSRMDAHFRSLRLPFAVEAGETVAGFVFTHLDRGAKYVNVELVSNVARKVLRFGVLVEVPGLRTDYKQFDPDAFHQPGEIRDLDRAGLREWLEALPCCVIGGDHKSPGDPLNIVVVGTRSAVYSAFARRGWHVTETTGAGSVFRTITSSLFGSRYRYSPVSPLYVFDRYQDVALQKARTNVNKRNHLRLWLAPVSVDGLPVRVGQISRDIGVRLSSKTITTHKIDPDVDDTRWYLLQDLFYSQGLDRFGFVGGVGEAPQNAPRRNYTGDPYFTDGRRAVFFMTEQPTSFREVGAIDW